MNEIFASFPLKNLFFSQVHVRCSGNGDTGQKINTWSCKRHQLGHSPALPPSQCSVHACRVEQISSVDFLHLCVP